MNINTFWLRTLGILGIVGGLILWAGDMLLCYNGSSTALYLNTSTTSDTRVIASAITALISSWFYVLGLGQVYYAFKPTSEVIRNTVIISFGAILMGYGVVHGAFIAIATSAKLAAEHNLDFESTILLATTANNAIRVLLYPIFALLSILFIAQVWKKNTLYPRWMILFFPLFLFLFQGVLDIILSGKAWVIIMGGYLNLMVAVFFTASTIALWRPKE